MNMATYHSRRAAGLCVRCGIPAKAHACPECAEEMQLSDAFRACSPPQGSLSQGRRSVLLLR